MRGRKRQRKKALRLEGQLRMQRFVWMNILRLQRAGARVLIWKAKGGTCYVSRPRRRSRVVWFAGSGK